MHGSTDVKFINAKQAKKHTNIGTSNENSIKKTQQSGTIKYAGTNR